MSGHSKWANIKVRKGAADKKRGVVFSKIAKDILTAVREGGGNVNPDSNLFLKSAIDKAREVNMPKENIERLLKNFEERRANLVQMTMEGYGPMGVPMIVELETDNKNRTLGEIKSQFRKHDGDLGVSGSVVFLFQKRGEVELQKIEPEIELELIDWGVEDIRDNTLIVLPEKLAQIKEKCVGRGLEVLRAEVTMRPITPVKLTDDEMLKVIELIEDLEDMEDVISVWSGLDDSKSAEQE